MYPPAAESDHQRTVTTVGLCLCGSSSLLQTAVSRLHPSADNSWRFNSSFRMTSFSVYSEVYCVISFELEAKLSNIAFTKPTCALMKRWCSRKSVQQCVWYVGTVGLIRAAVMTCSCQCNRELMLGSLLDSWCASFSWSFSARNADIQDEQQLLSYLR